MIQIRATPERATLDAPIEHLRACHRRIEQRLDTLERAAAHLQTNSSEALAAIRSVFHFMDTNGAFHTADEEESFFPRFANLLTPDEQSYVRQLHAEHARAEAIYVELKSFIENAADPPTAEQSQQCAALAAQLCALYRQHIHAEDARFPSIAQRVLSEADLEAISQEMKHRRGI